jgi:hypothetical protein
MGISQGATRNKKHGLKGRQWRETFEEVRMQAWFGHDRSIELLWTVRIRDRRTTHEQEPSKEKTEIEGDMINNPIRQQQGRRPRIANIGVDQKVGGGRADMAGRNVTAEVTINGGK